MHKLLRPTSVFVAALVSILAILFIIQARFDEGSSRRVETSPTVSANEGSIAVGGNVSGHTITLGNGAEKVTQSSAEKPESLTGIPGIVPPTPAPGEFGGATNTLNQPSIIGSVLQRTDGSCSPAAAGVSGNVTISSSCKAVDPPNTSELMQNKNPLGKDNSLVKDNLGAMIGGDNGDVANIIRDPVSAILGVGQSSARPTAGRDQNDDKPSDPFEEQRREIERHLRSIPARYNVPDRLSYGRSIQVSFVLEPQGPGTGAARLVNLPGKVETATVQVSPQVKAELTGPKDLVQIELRGGDEAKRKAVTLVAPVQWVWDVKAIGQGMANLHLELVAYIPNKDNETSFQWPTFERQIPIEISWPDQAKILVSDISSLVSPIWAGIVAAATGLAGLIAYFGWKPSFGQAQGADGEGTRKGKRQGRVPRGKPPGS